jgi:hypothetical protein
MSYQIFAAARQILPAAKAWAVARKAARELASCRYDPVSAPVGGPLHSLLIGSY